MKSAASVSIIPAKVGRTTLNGWRISSRACRRRGRGTLDPVKARLLELVAVRDSARRYALRDVVSELLSARVLVVHAVEGFRVLGLGIPARMIRRRPGL